MKRYSVTRGDNGPPLNITLETGGAAQVLTGASAVMTMRHRVTPTVIETFTLDIVGATTGKVRKAWTSEETAALTPGTYDCTILVTFANGDLRTFPSDGGKEPIRVA